MTLDGRLDRSATAMARGIREGEISSRELVTAHLARIAAVNDELNAVVQLRAEQALEEAAVADRAVAAGAPLKPLHGVPFTVKDAIATAGVVTTGGIPGRAGMVPDRDATVVARMKAAGAILLGKTNCPAFCAGAETDNEIYGRTSNPHDPALSVASSSGGEAAMIAAGGSPLGLGSDTGGSIRFPAHFCGVAGLCPTYGRVPRTGHIPAYFGSADTSVIGPLARSVEDLAAALAVLAGVDWVDPTVVPAPLGDPAAVAVAELRIAYHTDNGIYTPTDEVQAAVQAAVAVLQDRGATVTEACPDGIEEVLEIGQGISRVGWDHEINVTGVYTEAADVNVAALRESYDAAIAEARALESPKVQPGVEYYLWTGKADLYRSRMLGFMREFDAIVCPVMGYAAQPHGFSAADDFDIRGYVGYTHPYSMVGWPSVVVPVGETAEGLPIDVQVVARPWREDVALAVGSEVEDMRCPTAWGPD